MTYTQNDIVRVGTTYIYLSWRQASYFATFIILKVNAERVLIVPIRLVFYFVSRKKFEDIKLVKVVNRTITDLSYDHLPTKFETVSQNLSECFLLRFPIYDLWL